MRPDMVFYANSDAHRVSAGFDEVLIPVEWVEDKRTRERTRLTLRMTREAMEAGRALTIFPAGRIARRQKDGAIADPAWAPSAVSVARKYEAPIAPVHISGPYSAMFHFFNRFSGELRDITLFHELLNKTRQGLPRDRRPDHRAGAAPRGRRRGDARPQSLHRAGTPAASGTAVRMRRSGEACVLENEADTERLGETLAAHLQAGEAVCLSGPLGAGKSVLARALVRALSPGERDVPSPTFTLVQSYDGGPRFPSPISTSIACARRRRRTSSALTRRWRRGRR